MRGSACLLALLGLVLAASPAAAQFIAFQADRFGAPLGDRLITARLGAMGGMRYVIPDENLEINLSDFGRNIAARARDKDPGWTLENGYSRFRRTEDFVANIGRGDFAQREVLTQEGALALASFRMDTGRAFGGQVVWNAQQVTERVGTDSRTRGPNMSAYWNETVGPFELGLGVTRFNDNEAITSTDLFAIRHFSSLIRYSLGALYSFGGLDWGAQVDFDQVTIRGKSRDDSGFHQDDFLWRRPTLRYQFSAFLPEGGDLEAGINLRAFDLEGREQVSISWSDRFPANPGGFNFDKTLGTFEESESGVRVEARALYWLGYAPRVGGFFAFEERSSEVVESVNFLGSRRQGQVEQTKLELGGGFGTSFLSEVLTLALEVEGEFAEVTETDRLGVSSDRSTRDVMVRGGVEWFVRTNLALRAGYDWLASDTDLNGPFSLQTGNGANLGFGFLPHGGIFSVDGVFRYVDREPKETGGRSLETDGFEVGLYTRLLF